MNERTKWEGLWFQREGIYAGYTIKKTDIPKYSKLILRYNKYYSKASGKPKFVYCFANGDSKKAITMEKDEESFRTVEAMAEEIKKLKEEIEDMYTYEQVKEAIHGANRDGVNGYTDIMVSDYI